jgi:hypothetical protein
MSHTHTHTHSRKPLLAGVLVIALTCLGLAACGSSGNSSSTPTTNAANTSTTGAGTGPGARAGRFAAMRACLQKEGITLPTRTPGQPRTPGAGGFLGGGGAGPQLPKGVTHAQFEAALKKCGGGRRFGGSGAGRSNSPAFRTAVTAFAECMRQNGIALPAPNTTGTGPVFDTKGINTASPQFTAARTKCQSKLAGAYARPGGAAGAGGGGA